MSTWLNQNLDGIIISIVSIVVSSIVIPMCIYLVRRYFFQKEGPIQSTILKGVQSSIKTLKINTALEHLESLKESQWDNFSKLTKKEWHYLAGTCLSLLKKNKEAAIEYEEVSRFAENDQTKFWYKTLSALERDDLDAAAEWNYKALMIDQSLPSAICHRILIAHKQGNDLATIEELIPETCRKDPEVLTQLGRLYSFEKQFDKAIKYLRDVTPSPNWLVSDFEDQLGAAYLGKALESKFFIETKQITIELDLLLEEAEKHLEKAWNQVSCSDVPEIFFDKTANNYILCLACRGKKDKAVDLLFRANDLNISDSIIISISTIALNILKDTYSAKKLITPAKKRGNLDARFIYGLILHNESKHKEALEEFNLIKDHIDELKEPELFTHFFLASMTEEGLFDEAFAWLNKSPIQDSDLIVEKSLLLFRNGNIEAAKSLLDNPPSPDNVDEFRSANLASLMFKLGMYQQALPYFEKILKPTTVSHFFQNYIYCLYFVGQGQQALSLVGAVRKAGKPHKTITLLEVELLLISFNYLEAADIIKEYIKEYPDELPAKILQLELSIRIPNKELASCLLDQLISFDFKEINHWTTVLRAMAFLEKNEELLIKLCSFLRRFWNSIEARRFAFQTHIQYLNMQINDVPHVVGSNSAVEMIDEFENRIWICFVQENPVSDLHEYHPSVSWAKDVIGKKIGDVVEYGNTPSPSNRKILKIINNNEYIIRELYKKIHEHPEDFGVISFNYKSIKDLTHVIQVLSKKDNRKQLVEQYESGKIPVGLLVNRISYDEYDFWKGHSQTIGKRSSHGSIEEQRYDKYVVNENRPNQLVVDLWGILSLHFLDLQKLIIDAFSTIKVSRTTLNRLYSILYELTKPVHSRPMGHLINTSERPILIESDKQYCQIKEDDIRAQIRWVEEFCEVIPCTHRFYMAEDVATLSTLLTQESADSLIIANEQSICLYSDDGLIHHVGTYYKKPVVRLWTESILLLLKQQKIINQEDEYQYKMKMIILNYCTISVNVGFFKYWFEKEKYHITEQLEVVFGYSKTWSIKSLSDIISDLIYSILLEGELWKLASSLFDHWMVKYVNDRIEDLVQQIYNKVYARLSQSRVELPNQISKLKNWANIYIDLPSE